jgi:hypothetical protein
MISSYQLLAVSYQLYDKLILPFYIICIQAFLMAFVLLAATIAF